MSLAANELKPHPESKIAKIFAKKNRLTNLDLEKKSRKFFGPWSTIDNLKRARGMIESSRRSLEKRRQDLVAKGVYPTRLDEGIASRRKDVKKAERLFCGRCGTSHDRQTQTSALHDTLLGQG
ncbi:hypothetical protein ACFL2Q_08115 [Thermodesulfobacteriota bacterium]